MEAIGKKKGCGDILLWVQSIKNHIYWCAASSGDDKDLVKEKWISIVNHLINIHEGHGELFPTCQHDKIDRQWLEPGNFHDL